MVSERASKALASVIDIHCKGGGGTRSRASSSRGGGRKILIIDLRRPTASLGKVVTGTVVILVEAIALPHTVVVVGTNDPGIFSTTTWASLATISFSP